MDHLPAPLSELLARTPARVLLGRAGTAYRTSTQLALRRDHAAARDAVHTELALEQVASPDVRQRLGLFEVQTQASSKSEYLMRPDLGRCFSPPARERLQQDCPCRTDLQVVLGDGLSAAAVARQVPDLLPLLEEHSARRNWVFGRPFLVRYCRVGILNDVGELLDPRVVVLLIGERPGLATAESLSAYMAYQPRPGHTDAERNLISNIHERGVPLTEAATRIFRLAEQMRAASSSGVRIKEEFPALVMPSSRYLG